MEIKVSSEREMRAFGIRLGASLEGGEVIQLVGDVGAGKTTLVKAIAKGMDIQDDISSPSYALSQRYDAPHGLHLIHYDFYRLDEPGILANELSEQLLDKQNVVVIEWGSIVSGVVPADYLEVNLVPLNDEARRLTLKAHGQNSDRLLEGLR